MVLSNNYIIIICLHTVIWFQVFQSNTNNLGYNKRILQRIKKAEIKTNL